MLPLSSQCETPHPSYKPPHQLLPGLCVRYMRSLWKEKEMERQAPLRIEANSFSLEKCPLLLQQAAEAPACLEINIMLVSGGGHKHETVFCFENKPYLLTNHLICQKTMSTASICVLSLGDSLSTAIKRDKDMLTSSRCPVIIRLACMHKVCIPPANPLRQLATLGQWSSVSDSDALRQPQCQPAPMSTHPHPEDTLRATDGVECVR